MKAIACMSLNRCIGKDNNIPWHISEDFKFFKNKTLNQKIVMGRTTFEAVGPLPNRDIYVLSRRFPDKYFESNLDLQSIDRNNTKVIPIKELTEIPNDSWICGGANIYEQTLDLCTEFYLTLVHLEVEGDTFLPFFEDEFTLVSSEELNTKNGIKIEFKKYINNKVLNFNPLEHEQTR